MWPRAQAAFLAVLGISGWAGAGWVLMELPPASEVALGAFYSCAFVAIACTAAVAAWLVLRPRATRGRLRSPMGYAGHGGTLAAIALFGLWLQSLRMLTPTVTFLLVGLYVCLELALLFGTRGTVDVKAPRETAASRA